MPKPTPAASPRKPARPPAGVETHESKPGAEPTPVKSGEIDNYTVALKYLSERTNVERTRPERVSADAFRLDRMAALLDQLDNPQRDVRCVHVAGSKGKGSVVEMTASCLAACGYTTGVYTSPHLVDIRERIRISREMIGYVPFARLTQRVAAAGEAVRKKHGEPTYFEVMTAVALLHFAEQAVDIAVIEVGLGGRLDATNLVQPEVTAVTAIQLEHTALLGDTVEKIAAEKAGIFKPGVTALTIPQSKSVLEVFRQAAAAAGAPLEILGQEIEFSCRFEATPDLGPHTRVCVTTPRSNFEHLPVPLKGEHQAANCGLALAILDKLRDRGFDTPERKVALGLACTPCEGRLEVVSHSPRIVLDGAHTPDSIQCLIRAIGAHLRYDSMVVVFGCASDKDAKRMLEKVALGADKVIFTRAGGSSRATDPRELARRFAEISPKMAQIARTLPDALSLAARAVGRDDLICVTGSFYLVGEAKRYLQDAAARRTGAARG